jgi:hypothetical protein
MGELSLYTAACKKFKDDMTALKDSFLSDLMSPVRKAVEFSCECVGKGKTTE